MKTIIVIAIAIGVTISGVLGYLYEQMHDCLFPPTWMKIPRSYTLPDCLKMYSEGILPDYTQARKDFADSQARKMELLERYKDESIVVAFYAKYDDANVSVRDDHVSYFAGNEDDFQVRMNLYFYENYDLEHIDFHCYVGNQHKTEVAPEDILSYLENYDCEE
jgi:hypothetical protein